MVFIFCLLHYTGKSHRPPAQSSQIYGMSESEVNEQFDASDWGLQASCRDEGCPVPGAVVRVVSGAVLGYLPLALGA